MIHPLKRLSGLIYPPKCPFCQSLLEDDMIVQLRKFTSEELGKKYGKVAAQEAEHSEASSG